MKPTLPLLLVLLAIAWLCKVTLLLVPVQYFGRTESLGALQHSPDQTYAYAVEILAGLGGVPSDAVAQRFVEMRRGEGEAVRIGDTYQWHHRDVLGSEDFILVSVKERADGTMYPFTIIRKWHPLWFITLEQQAIRASSRALPAFASLKSSCPRGVDADAVARVLGARLTHLAYGTWRHGRVNPLSPPELSARIAATVTWNTSVTLQAGELGIGAGQTYPIQAREAWVSDGPTGERFRSILLYAPGPVSRQGLTWQWIDFASADTEHVCRQ